MSWEFEKPTVSKIAFVPRTWHTLANKVLSTPPEKATPTVLMSKIACFTLSKMAFFRSVFNNLDQILLYTFMP